MLSNKTIFILYSCNEWKEHSSMAAVAASTSMDDIYRVIKKEIRLGNMDYDGFTKRNGVKIFNEALENNRIRLEMLDYGYIEELDNMAAVKPRKQNERRLAI